MAMGGSFEKKRMKMNDLDDTLYPVNSALAKEITNKIQGWIKQNVVDWHVLSNIFLKIHTRKGFYKNPLEQ
uniref:Uncharacterized protein n=1 Tax=Cucumis melo TaxID=3656 RepID=A0A9I9E9W1_CUCME